MDRPNHEKDPLVRIYGSEWARIKGCKTNGWNQNTGKLLLIY